MANVPTSKPQLTQDAVREILNKNGITEKVAVVGIRGYYRKTMGNPLKNDRGIYDDALFIISPDFFASYNANTDPSKFANAIAVLKLGKWRYKPGKHKINSPNGYPAFVQAGPVTVIRDGVGEDTGWFGINIHKGGYNSTSSLGCQTIYPTQWDFEKTLNAQLKRHGQKEFWYVLIEEYN
jgi:lysozyme